MPVGSGAAKLMEEKKENRGNLPKIIVIVGTNASGKSALGIELAQKYQGEIISADSRQIYEGFDLCCGKVTKEERELVPHHLLDVCPVGEPYSVSDYQKEVYAVVPQIIQRGHLPFLVGGTGLYVSSVVNGYEFKEEQLDSRLRAELEAKSLEELLKMLPSEGEAYLKDHPADAKNKRRIARMLERVQNGEDLCPRNEPRFRALQLGVSWDREVLDRRIDERLSLRLKQGMVEEVRQYLDAGGDPERMYKLGLEYRYIAWYLAGKYPTFEEFYVELFRAIRQFAKRQVTWFRRDQSIHWLDMGGDCAAQASRLIDDFLGNAL